MEYIFIICICVLTMIILKFAWSIKIKDIKKLKELGYDKITGTTVYKWNLSSQRMHEKLGFVKVDENDDEYIYELNL